MAATRQPFGPVDSSRLQTLTSLKNRQNGMFTSHFLSSHLTSSQLPTALPSPSSNQNNESHTSSHSALDPLLRHEA